MSKLNRNIICFFVLASCVQAQQHAPTNRDEKDTHRNPIVNPKHDYPARIIDQVAPDDENESAGATSGDPCGKAGELFDGNNDLEALPVDYPDDRDARYMEMVCFGYNCDSFSCVPPFPFQWGKYTATCTEVVSLTTYSSNDDVGTHSLVFPTCDCPLEFEDAFPACVLDHGTLSFPAIEGKCYTIAIFSGDTLIIEPLKDLTYICDYFPPGDYLGGRRRPYDNVAALVSCQFDCASPSCIKCFDLDVDGQIDLRDFAEFQNNFPKFFW